MPFKYLVIFTYCYITSFTCSSQDQKKGVLYGEKFSYIISPPSEWKLDNKSGMPEGLKVVLYPRNESWQATENFIYVEGYTKIKGETFNSFIKKDSLKWFDHYKGIKIKSMGTGYFENCAYPKKAYLYGEGSYKYYACAVYLNLPTSIATIVLSSTTKEGLVKNINKLSETIALFKDVTENIKVTSEK